MLRVVFVGARVCSVAISGWALISAFASSPTGAVYFEGKRVPRPDVAKGNRLLDRVGFEVVGSLSNTPVGEYKLSIASGTEFVIAMCKTQVVVRVSE